jgi:hypothetical protein
MDWQKFWLLLRGVFWSLLPGILLILGFGASGFVSGFMVGDSATPVVGVILPPIISAISAGIVAFFQRQPKPEETSVPSRHSQWIYPQSSNQVQKGTVYDDCTVSVPAKPISPDKNLVLSEAFEYTSLEVAGQ